jgi:predicted Zn-dependent protease
MIPDLAVIIELYIAFRTIKNTAFFGQLPIEPGKCLIAIPQSANSNARSWLLGFALTANHKPEEAIPLLERAASGSAQSPGVIGGLVRANAEAGRRADALRWLNELKRRQKTGYVPAAAFVDAVRKVAFQFSRK